MIGFSCTGCDVPGLDPGDIGVQREIHALHTGNGEPEALEIARKGGGDFLKIGSHQGEPGDAQNLERLYRGREHGGAPMRVARSCKGIDDILFPTNRLPEVQ